MPIEIKNRTKLIIYPSGIANPNHKEVVLHFCWNAFYRKDSTGQDVEKSTCPHPARAHHVLAVISSTTLVWVLFLKN